MYKAKILKRGFPTPKMSGQLENYPKRNSNFRMHNTSVKSNRNFKNKSDDILMDIIKEAKDMRSSYHFQSRDMIKRSLSSRIMQSPYNLPPENKYLKNEQHESLFSRDHLKEKYNYPVEYPPIKEKIAMDFSEANINLEIASLRIALRKLQHYLSDKEFTFNSAIMCLDRSLHATHCPFFLDYSVRKGYIEKEGVLKLGSVIIGFGKSFSEEETQKLAYIDALKSLKFKRIEEILNANDSETEYFQQPNNNLIILSPKKKSLSELIVIETDLFAADRFKYSISILHNSVLSNKMLIKWSNTSELGVFKTNVYIQDKLLGTGRGAGKPEAKKNAACDALFNYFYRNNIVLQIGSEVESETWIPYSNVMYLVGEVKRRKSSHSNDESADNSSFVTVIENLIDNYKWTILNNELVFGPGLSNEQAGIIKKVGEKRNLFFRRKKYKDGHYFSLSSGEEYGDIVKYIQKNGGGGAKYIIIPNSDIPDLKTAKWQYYQREANNAIENKRNAKKMPDYYRNYNDGNFVVRGDQLSRNESGHKNISDSCTNMNQDSYDFKGHSYFKHSDNKREFDHHFLNSPNFSKSNINLEESKYISNIGDNQHINSNSSYYDRNYTSNAYERERNISNWINSDVNINHNEGTLYSHNQRHTMDDEDRYNSIGDQGNTFHHSETGFNQRSYDLGCNPARDHMLSADTNTFDSRYYRKNFEPATGEKMEDFTYIRNNRAFDLTESNDNYHPRTVYDYNTVNNKTGFNPSSIYNSRDITAAPNERTGFNQEYSAGNPVQNYDREFTCLPDQHSKPYMYAQLKEKKFPMESREEMFDNRNFHPMSRREFNETPSFHNKRIGQNPLDISFNQIDKTNVSNLSVAQRTGSKYGNAKRKNRNKPFKKLRNTPRNIATLRTGKKAFVKPWLSTNNGKVPGNASISAAQNIQMQRLELSKLNNNISSRNMTPIMTMNQPASNNQVMLLKFLTKKIAQNALQNNVKNILANAKRLSNIAKSRQMMERPNVISNKAKNIPFTVKKKPNLSGGKSESEKGKNKKAPSKETPKKISNTTKSTKVKGANLPPKKLKK